MVQAEDLFAPFVAALGRGPGRSRDLTREEARTAFGMILANEARPEQLGAFLMLLRYRGENPATIAGIVGAARAHAGFPLPLQADLDWPSYGAGRTRDQPWFLLAALALAAHGIKICMHGTNEFGTAVQISEALQTLNRSPARTQTEAESQLQETNFTYLPLQDWAPKLHGLLNLRRLFGLRSPVNTAVRLLNPSGAAVSVDGVFHPPYIETHLGAAELLNQPRLLVIKGGGGEFERAAAKPQTAHLWNNGRTETQFPPLAGNPAQPPLAEVWHGTAEPPAPVIATIALALFALGRTETPEQSDAQAAELWTSR